MFEILPKSHDDLLAVRARDTLTVEDYEKTIIPRLNELFSRYETIRAMIIFDEDFSGWAGLRAAWDDARIGITHPNDFRKIALVGSPEWMDWGVMIFGFFARGDFRFFPREKLDEAWKWLEQDDRTEPS
jgi:hypothetical protein